MNKIITIDPDELSISSLAAGQVHRIQIKLSDNSMGVPWKVPVIVVKGACQGPTLGITAALHGNELNGISTIFKLVEEIDPAKLNGSLVLLPISNVPGFLMNQREFSDNVDLNRIMPGKEMGMASSRYAYYLVHKIIDKFNYHLDLHTAGIGRMNSLYIRADLENEETRTLAFLQNPQIIVQKYDEEGTLRAWANDNGIPSITIEIGNPNAFQHGLIDETLEGILNTMRHYKMLDGDVKDMIHNATVCEHSYWIHTNAGGIIDIYPKLADRVKKGEVIAKIYNIFGELKQDLLADRSGIVIGKNFSPNCEDGSRILHIGVDIIDPQPEDIPGSDEFTES
jgi:predicted deacylase